MKSASRHLLLVEDFGLAPALVPLFTNQGWVVRSCTGAREAMYVGRQWHVDTLLAAVKLPDESGDTVFYRLAIEYFHLYTRTVFLVTDSEEQARVDRIGGKWIQLPNSPEIILQNFLQLLAKRRGSGA